MLRHNNMIYQSLVYKFLYSLLISYPVPINIQNWWNFGFLSGIFLCVQIVTGIFLTFFYIPDSLIAYDCVQGIMREINYGWLVRYCHLNGAAFFFLMVYLHVGRGLFYKSYFFPRINVWVVGVVILFCMMGTAFLGYVLPWGQMSFWAATVITNFLTAVPVVGQNLVFIVWGGYAINAATLTRFFSLHYILPFVILLLVVLHVLFLHDSRSSTPLGVKVSKYLFVSFHPYFVVKDSLFFIFVWFVFGYIIGLLDPELLNHSDNYIPADPMVTPPHIVPEIYFLPFYGILKTISHKLVGIIVMLVSIFILVLLPFISVSLELHKTIHRALGNKIKHAKRVFCLVVINFLSLGYIGGENPDYPWTSVGAVANHIYILGYFSLMSINQSRVRGYRNRGLFSDRYIRIPKFVFVFRSRVGTYPYNNSTPEGAYCPKKKETNVRFRIHCF
jgi:quinol-cytochrome oxidoreductase complex cytochrome b subunit